MNKKLKVGITIGDINGIGPEVIIKALSDERVFKYLNVIIYGSSKAITFYKQNIKVDQFRFNVLKDQAKLNSKIANIINCTDKTVLVEPGEITDIAGEIALTSLDKALRHLADKKIDYIVTAPLNKHTIKVPDYEFIGHTEYISQYFGQDDSLMMMTDENIRVGLVTGHTALNKVSEMISPEKLEKKLILMYQSLKKDFLIYKPKIAVLALNPHAGENGLMGDEEKEKIIPVIEKYQKKGMIIHGPFPADAFFGNKNYSNFDGIVAMYHDQGLIPFKSLAFHSGVNFTAGLPIVRTSPDHGTAYDIAGKNEASAQSMINAIFTGMDIVRNRKEYKLMTSSPLLKSELDKESGL